MRWKIVGCVWVVMWVMAARAQTGIDAGSGIAWTLISTDGKVVGTGAAERVPRLTAQCTKDAKGKLHFELLADVGDVAEVLFVPPFRPARDGAFPPSLPKAAVTMEFLGYMKVKPVKRQWVAIDGLAGEWKYATPGMRSGNMEEVMFYLQYLKALPTLRLTLPNGTGKPVVVEFETTRWQAKVKAEPMCWASAL